ncbi:hypothetical protein Syun_021863 [Stephania yunnanensis]|uniref:PPM-type phosphatase domain-containing protein n=1 Tax=Stephania yunnanensis TaxID=152371 RepID=A0AAP0IHU3_9MAGN
MMVDSFLLEKRDNRNSDANHKREAACSDLDIASKKSKLHDLKPENGEKSGEILDQCKPKKCEANSTETDCLDDSNGQLVGSAEQKEGNRLEKKNDICEERNSISSELSIDIEADAAEDKGSRHSMEDAWVVLTDTSLNSSQKLRCAHFAIFDGHGGRLAAEYAQKHLHSNVLSAGLPRELVDVRAAKKSILDGFRKTDESLLQESAGGWQDGATAVCIWVLGKTVFVANIGDAKAVVARSYVPDGSQSQSARTDPLKAIVLTREHKAIYPQERARILKAGGSISTNGRLQGRLEVSRAFGDRQFKKVGVIVTPDVHSFDLTERDSFIILGCDGLWGYVLVFGPSDAVDFVQQHLKDFRGFDVSEIANLGYGEGLSVTAVSRRLVKEAVRERRCKDNCTAIVIAFKHK